MKRALYFIAVLYSVMACQSGSKPQETQTQTPDSTASTDSLVMDLVAEKPRLGTPETISVSNDPVFHKNKTFEAIPLETVLKKIPGYETVSPTETSVIFECEDGYNPSMPLEKVLGTRAYLAIRDRDAPQGQDWTTLQKGSETKKIAPFYVCYTDTKLDDTYKWPYNLVRIRLMPTSKETAALFPEEDDSVVKGYGLFKTHCLTCHAMNGTGGVLGPELNTPKSVTEYWKPDDLKAFIAKPESYRHNVKMPNLGLKSADIEAIVGYLSYMAKHKKTMK